MGFGSILEIEPFFVDPPLIQVLRDRWDWVSRTFLFPWGHMVPSLEDVARITGLRVDGEAVTGVTYADYTDFTQSLLGLEPHGDDLGDRRMVGRVALLESLGLIGVRQRADESLSAFVERAAGLARLAYGQDREETERVDRDLRRFLVFFFGKMLFTTKGDGIHCRFLELLGDLGRVGRYAWGAALLAHTFADLSVGTGMETTVGGFAPFLQVWSYYYLPLGRATQVDPDAVPLARRWLPLVSTATYNFQLDVLRRNIRDFPALLVVWEPYVDQGDDDQPWVVSGRPLFRRDIWVHCLNEIEPLRLRLAARTLGLHQRWLEETEPRGIGRKTRGKAKTVDWRVRFPDQYADWGRGGWLVVGCHRQHCVPPMLPGGVRRSQFHEAIEEVQLAEARAALETLPTAQATAEHTDAGGASSSRSVPAVEVASLQEQLAAAVTRAERAERDLLTRTEELESALARETGTVAELTEQSRQLTELRSQLAQRESDLPCDVAELQAMLTLERCDLESQVVAERLLKASEERYRCGRECAREQGRASAYSESILVTSSQYERNVRDVAAAQRSTSSRAPMGPPSLPAVVDQGEVESSRRAGPADGGEESQVASP
ncbi:hypothetical protein Taro_054384 [Colocasia esculenta]|uniref:Aminotransferase-like plant mobile domain-containing protein n=1 Tax=Colocasia esculenta TaxID=4460 RepID=A0A843XNJ4_COLES|nr:hypothetical protein [Colocasia esculenta]